MRIAIGCDDAGFPWKMPLITALESEGHVILDLGCFSTDPVDYPDYARVVGQAVLRGFADAGVLVCGSATGASIAANNRVNVPRALFVVSSTSGASAETLALYRLCRARVDAATVTKPGSQFVAITDPGTPLADLAREGGFRHTFLNPASIGDRYAALSYVGAVPAVLLGVDVRTLLERARTMVEQSGNGVSAHESAPVRLGAALAAFARSGRDKVTLVLSEKIRAFGPWLELMLAESLGKEGRGVVPIVDDPLGAPAVYGPDRLFVALLLGEDDSHDAALVALADAGHPVIRITLKDALDVGAEFFRWELATATAGAVLGVNPFDAPDAPLTTDHANRLLTQWPKTRRLPEWKADVEEAGIALITGGDPTPTSVAQGIASHLARARPGDYLAIQAPRAERRDRTAASDAARAPTRSTPNRDDARLRPVSARHRPAPQGRAAERTLHPDHGAGHGGARHSRRGLRLRHVQCRAGPVRL